jgi:hypothetical protein
LSSGSGRPRSVQKPNFEGPESKQFPKRFWGPTYLTVVKKCKLKWLLFTVLSSPCSHATSKKPELIRNKEFLSFSPHGKAGEVYTSLKTASCETGPGTTLIHNKESCIWSLQIQEYDDGWCFPNSICDLLQ